MSIWYFWKKTKGGTLLCQNFACKILLPLGTDTWNFRRIGDENFFDIEGVPLWIFTRISNWHFMPLLGPFFKTKGPNRAIECFLWLWPSVRRGGSRTTMATMIYRLPTVPTPNWLPPLATRSNVPEYIRTYTVYVVLGNEGKNKIRGVDPYIRRTFLMYLIHCLWEPFLDCTLCYYCWLLLCCGVR